MTCESFVERDRAGVIPVRENGAWLDMRRSASRGWRGAAIDAVLVAMIAVVLGVAVGYVLAGPVAGAVFALLAAIAFPLVLQTINTTG